MATITIQDIQRDPLGRVEAEETLLVVRGEQPVAEIKPIPARPRELRPFGLCAGDFTVPDDFDASLPDSVLIDLDSSR